MARKKTVLEFRKDIIKKVGLNALIGFWMGFYYRKYQDDVITFEQAVEDLTKMKLYTGV